MLSELYRYNNALFQMLLFLITCSLSLILFNPKPMRNTLLALNFSFFSSKMSHRTTISIPKSAKVEPNSSISLLDLPDLVLECILEKLPPDGLCRMASVCTSLRDMCLCDHFWEKHMQRKWGRIVGPRAYTVEHIAERTNEGKDHKGLFGYLFKLMPGFTKFSEKKNFGAVDSVMSRYVAIESGDFWFPAQVYNRENGIVGFVLSCYDAMVSYDGTSDTFRARYPPHGARSSLIESGVTWDRVRAPPFETSPHDLHISDCLYDLQPGDQVEIQWRRNKVFPYGWWYGVVGHLETCDVDANYCRCHNSVHAWVPLEKNDRQQERPPRRGEQSRRVLRWGPETLWKRRDFHVEEAVACSGIGIGRLRDCLEIQVDGQNHLFLKLSPSSFSF